MTIIFLIAALLCFGYYIYIAAYAGFSSSFISFWLAAGICFFLLGLFWFLGKKYDIFAYIPKLLKLIVMLCVAICLCIFLAVEGFILTKMNSQPEGKTEYLIVLGAQVRGERVTKSLAKRLDAAIEYMNENPDTKVIVSGAQGTGEDISEAEAMRRYLVARSIDESLIIMEEKSTSTKENLKYSYELIQDKSAKIAVVTNNFHVYRALKLAKKQGIDNVQGLAASADNRLLVNYMVREFFAVLKEKVAGNI